MDLARLLSLSGITIYESEFVPYKPGKGWFPIGPGQVVMHPDALRDMLEQIGEQGRLTVVRPIQGAESTTGDTQ